jgi:hypothetical protein
MMDGLNNLSTEELNRLSRTINEAKELLRQQELLLQQTLTIEQQIINRRVAGLREYNDEYSRMLNTIASENTALRNEMLSITQAGKDAADAAEKTAKSAERVKASTSSSASNGNAGDGDGSGSNNNNGGKKVDSNESPAVSEDRRKELKEADTAENIAARFKKYATLDEQLEATLTRQKDAAISIEQLKEARKANRKKMDDEYAEQAINVEKTLTALTMARLQDRLPESHDKEAQRRAVQMSHIQDTAAAELRAQELINQINAERALVENPETRDGALRVPERKAQAEEAAKSAQVLEEQRLRYIAQKELEFKLDNQRELTAADRANIITAANEEFKLDQKNLDRITEARKKFGDEHFEREKKYQNNLLALAALQLNETGDVRAERSRLAENEKSLQELSEARTNYIARKELEAKRKNNGILSAEEAAKIQKQANEKYKLDQKNLDNISKRRAELEAKAAAKERGAQIRKDVDNLLHGSWDERKDAWRNLTQDETGNADVSKLAAATVTALDKGLSALSDFAKKLEAKVDEIGSYKSAIDTRLQGSSNKTSGGSYWDQIVKDMTSIGAINPYFRQSDFASNIKSLVDQGIAFDLEQRAFLMTIQDKIATTFEVADGTLLRLIRIQQEDSTAGRLGMEAALNSFLNNMYENTEYLKQVADGVRSSLTEMQSLMSGAEAAEVEYQVQKWLGSLYSVGMSQNAVNSISQALGQIAAGQIEGLTGGGAGNLLIMAANDAGLSIADILTDGLDSSDTNKLMQAAVNYLAEVAESSKNNNVVQQQLADVFGVKASDLRAATNLVSKDSGNAIYANNMTYGNMLRYLTSMAGSMGSRTSMTEMLTNIWENTQYSLAGSMASNPITYFIYKMATVLDDTTGGISIPAISVVGNMVDLQTTVADLMRIGAISGGVLSSFGDLVSGISNSFNGQSMLSALGISSGSGLAVTPRGNGGLLSTPKGGGSTSTSGSGYVGNASGSDIKNSTIQESEDTKKQLMVEAQEEAEDSQVDFINATVLKIYELLDDVAHGNRSLSVKVEGYGLTRAGSSGSLGGVNALGGLGSNASLGSYSGGSGGGSNYGSSSSSTSSGSNLSSGGVNSGGISGSIDFGGWTTSL